MEAAQEPVCVPVWMPGREYQCQKCSLEPPWPILQCLLSPGDTVLIIKPSCEWYSTLDLRDHLFIVMLLFDNCCKNESTNKRNIMKNKKQFLPVSSWPRESFFRRPKILLLSTFWQSNQSKYHLKQANTVYLFLSLDYYYYTLCGCVCVCLSVLLRVQLVSGQLSECGTLAVAKVNGAVITWTWSGLAGRTEIEEEEGRSAPLPHSHSDLYNCSV